MESLIIAYSYDVPQWCVRGNELLRRLADLDISQAELARRARISPSYVCKLVARRETVVSRSVVLRIALALELPPPSSDEPLTFTSE